MKSTAHFDLRSCEGKRSLGFCLLSFFRWGWVNLYHSINHMCACACVCVRVCVRVFDQIQVDVQKSEKSSDRLVICTGRGNILLCQLPLARIDVRNYSMRIML